MTLNCARCGKTPDQVTGQWWRHILACDVVLVEKIVKRIPPPSTTGYGSELKEETKISRR